MTNLEFLRRSVGLTQEQFAKTLGTGFTAAHLSMMETGRLKPSARQATRLFGVTGIDAPTLLRAAKDAAVDLFNARIESK